MEVFLSWFIYLFLAALSLLVAHGLYSSCGWRGRLSSCGAHDCVVLVVASLVAEQTL